MATKTITILGLDPGKTHFGFAVAQFRPDSSFRPLVAGKVKNTVRDYGQLVPQMDHYIEEMRELLAYKPQIVVIERFMNRGKFAGDTGEYVSLMIGLVAYLARATLDSKIVIVQPGVWKSALNRVLGRKSGDKGPTHLDKLYRYCLTEPHELDAYLITHAAAAGVFRFAPFSTVTKKSKMKFLTEFEAVATGKKKRQRLGSKPI